MISKEQFIQNPNIILSYMMDFGFDPREVRILRIAISDDRKRFQDALSCPEGSVNGIVSKIADYCYVSEKALISLVYGIRTAMEGFSAGMDCYHAPDEVQESQDCEARKALTTPVNEIVEDEDFGKCIRSIDGTVFYSLDKKVLLKVMDVERFSVPNSVTKIREGAFSACESLQEVSIPDSVTEIGKRAFEGCNSLREVRIPNSITKIRESTFYGCESLREIRIPDSVTDIEMWAFACCESLLKVHIPDSVTKIGESAFLWCESLREVRIPKSVTKIGDRAFLWCDSAKFAVDSKNRFYKSINGKLVRKEPNVRRNNRSRRT